MNIKLYPKHNGPEAERGFSAEEIRRGDHTLYMDVTCPHCGKVQAVAQTGSMGGPCICCGNRTDGRNS